MDNTNPHVSLTSILKYDGIQKQRRCKQQKTDDANSLTLTRMPNFYQREKPIRINTSVLKYNGIKKQ